MKHRQKGVSAAAGGDGSAVVFGFGSAAVGIGVAVAFDVDVRQQAIEPARQPPVPVAEQLHRRRHEDEADMLAAVEKTSPQSLQRRFFVMKRHFSEKERAFFMDVDFKNHVAIVAVADEAGRKVIVGGGRYIVSALRHCLHG